MNHIFKEGEGKNKNTLLLLHGTGGDVRDLFPVANKFDKTASILSVRGKVKENGANVFFKKSANGSFDEEEVIFRTKELYEFLDRAAYEYGFDRKYVIAVGYSSGANIAGSLLYHYEKALQGAILFRPMVPRKGIDVPKMRGMPIFISGGLKDTICPPDETELLEHELLKAGANVEMFWGDWGHELENEEVEQASRWYKKQAWYIRK